jgi:glucose-fructose oxidoreductase
MKPVRFAVVGLGHISQKAVLPAFAHTKSRAVLHGIVSADPEKLSRIGEMYGVGVRGGYDDLERIAGECDAVYIATPNSLHAEHATRAARAGAHVLCEKPLATTEEECARMIDACRAAGVKLMIAYRLHFEPLTVGLLERLHGGVIGEPRFLTSTFSLHTRPGGVRTKAALGGGTLFDLGVYCINAARLVFQAEPVRVLASSVNGARSDMPEIDEMTSAILHYEGDCLATFTSSLAAASSGTLTIVGTKGRVVMDPAFDYGGALKYALTVGDKTTRHAGRKRDQFAAEIGYFATCIRQNREPEPSGREGAQDVRIVNALYESARTGASVAMPHIPDSFPTKHQAIGHPPTRHEPPLVNVEYPHK